jgi:hypothetical protein
VAELVGREDGVVAPQHPSTVLRDADRVLGHSYADEIDPPYEWEPYRFAWPDVIKFIVGMGLLYGLVIALVVMGTAAQ